MLSSTTSSLNTQEELDKVRWRLFGILHLHLCCQSGLSFRDLLKLDSQFYGIENNFTAKGADVLQ